MNMTLMIGMLQNRKYLIAYKNKWEDEDSQYDGIENYVSFTLNDETHKHLFYVHTTKEFNFLSIILKNNFTQLIRIKR
jgi:hypothetical protein